MKNYIGQWEKDSFFILSHFLISYDDILTMEREKEEEEWQEFIRLKTHKMHHRQIVCSLLV